MAPTISLQEQAEALLVAEGPVDVDAVADLSSAIQAHPPANPQERDELLTVLQSLLTRTRDELKAVGDAMRKIRTGRKALKGYGHLKATKTSQRADHLA